MIHHFRHRSANRFLVESRPSGKLLAVDTGWPCSLREYQRNLKALGLRFADLRWAIVTHFHPDHAGLIGEFQLNGIACHVFEHQEPAVDAMELAIRKNAEYSAHVPVDKGKPRPVDLGDFNEEPRRLGVDGAVVATPGHSPDSVSFLTGDNEAIIGDLPPPDQLAPEDLECLRSWGILRERGARTIYPGHAGGVPSASPTSKKGIAKSAGRPYTVQGSKAARFGISTAVARLPADFGRRREAGIASGGKDGHGAGRHRQAQLPGMHRFGAVRTPKGFRGSQHVFPLSGGLRARHASPRDMS
ncbi:MAG: MBL fold metallo-hydrolase [Spirochaetaceae bacterium]|nr:MBL fold metallo-hydrolase [Spirochaetaceae bacterium]